MSGIDRSSPSAQSHTSPAQTTSSNPQTSAVPNSKSQLPAPATKGVKLIPPPHRHVCLTDRRPIRRRSGPRSTTRTQVKTLEQKPSHLAWLDDIENLREARITYQEKPYRLFTNASEESRELHLRKHGDQIVFTVHTIEDSSEFELATFGWKLVDDIFSLQGETGLSPFEDEKCAFALKRIAACTAVELFTSPWPCPFQVSSPVVNCDLGGGHFIHVFQEDAFIGEEHTHRRTDYSSASEKHELRNIEFLQFLRWFEVITAQYLFPAAHTNTDSLAPPTASVIGTIDQVLQTFVDSKRDFSPTVRTLYGVLVDKYANLRKYWAQTADSTWSSSSKQSRELEELGPDLEKGGAHDENDDNANAFAPPNSGDVTVPPGPGRVSEESESILQGSTEGKRRIEQQLLCSNQPTPAHEDYQELEVYRNGDASNVCSPSATQTSQKRVIGGNFEPVREPHSTSNVSDSSSHEQQSSNRSKHGGIPLSIYRRRQFFRIQGDYDPETASLIARDLLTLLLLTIATILAVVVVALDPAGEKNWFKRIEEGVFVMFTILAPMILAMQSRLSHNLDVLMPKRSRRVSSLQDLRSQMKEVDEDRFYARLSESILTNECISELFLFENACYKITRNEEDGPLSIPNTVRYTGLFKQVWLFGGKYCLNTLTGEAFRYSNEDGMLLIERKPTNIQGVMVHIRRRHAVYRIGAEKK